MFPEEKLVTFMVKLLFQLKPASLRQSKYIVLNKDYGCDTNKLTFNKTGKRRTVVEGEGNYLKS